MKLTSTSFADGQKIPGEFAFCIPDPAHHVCLGKNLNPQLSWTDVPAGTRSFAIICHDPDVPSKGDDDPGRHSARQDARRQGFPGPLQATLRP